MAREIERKFLVASDGWRAEADAGQLILQAYLAAQDSNTLRVRIHGDGTAAIAIKAGWGMVREEFEYPVPIADARRMMDCAVGTVIEKRRHLLAHAGFIWEVDVYDGDLKGLVVAEVEMESVNDDPPIPPWAGRELTGEKAYSNLSLSLHGLPEAAV